MNQGTVLSYPIPAYSNVPINTQFYKPNRFVISGITLGCITIITTSENMNYVVGQQIRLLIPSSFGSFQLNESQGYVISIVAANQVGVNIDSSKNVNAFILSTATTKAQIVAIGDVNTGQINSNGPKMQSTDIPGSFINIS